MNNILIKNLESFDKKFSEISNGGLDKLHIIADFSKTLTRAKIGEEKSISTWDAFAPHMNDEYRSEWKRLLDTFLPIELNPDVSLEEKKPKLDEWWKAHLQLLINNGVTKEKVRTAIQSEKIAARDGLHQILQFCFEKNVPILLFSAGLGDIIKEFLAHHGMLYPNIHFLSNMFVFDEQEVAVGHEDTIVHTYNKADVLVTDHMYAQEIIGRPHVLLLGDSLGDIGMADGFSVNSILKIGFLNGNKEKLEAFSSAYDVVIEEDGGMEYVGQLLLEIAGE